MASAIIYLSSDINDVNALRDQLMTGRSKPEPLKLDGARPPTGLNKLAKYDAVYVVMGPALQARLTSDPTLMDALDEVDSQARLVALDMGGLKARTGGSRADGEAAAPDFSALFDETLDIHRPGTRVQVLVPAARELEQPEIPEGLIDGELLLAAELVPESRSTPGLVRELEQDNLILLEWSDGSTEWMTAADYASRFPTGDISGAPRSRQLGGLRPKRLFVEQLRGAKILRKLGRELGEDVAEALAELGAETSVVIRDAFVRKLTGFVEDYLASRRLKAEDSWRPKRHEKFALPPDRLPAERRADGDLLEFQSGTLYGINDDGALIDLKEDAKAWEDKDGEVLLFIHGTLKPTETGFAGLLREKTAWAALHYRFGGRVLAYQHRQWSFSPLENASHLLEQLKKSDLLGTADKPRKIVLMSHSRGGQVGELLCVRPDEPAPASWPQVDRDALANILTLSGLLDIRRYVRVAATIRGTSFLTGNLDRYINGFMSLLSSGVNAFLPWGSPIVRALHFALKILLKYIKRPGAVPGLASQRPTSPFVTWLNSASGAAATGQLFVVAGHSTVKNPSSALQWLLFGPIFKREDYNNRFAPHDHVVDTDYMWGGWPRAKGQSYLRMVSGADVAHGKYFSDPDRLEPILAALRGDPNAATRFDDRDVRDFITPGKVSSEASRGGLKTLLRIQKPLQPNTLGPRHRDVVILVPGLMGTHLKTSAGKGVWVDIDRIMAGAAEHLELKEPSLKTAGLLESYYGEFARYLHTVGGYRVVGFPYDWRLSLFTLGKQLAELVARELPKEASGERFKVHIAAHSMGGMVSRAMITLDVEGQNTAWRDLKASGGRLLQAGTPNLGAPGLLRLLATGDDWLLRTLNMFTDGDLRTRMRDMAGLLEMLPRPDRSGDYVKDTGNSDKPQAVYHRQSWNKWRRVLRPSNRRAIPSQENLKAAWTNVWRLDTHSRVDELGETPTDNRYFTYVAGSADSTIARVDDNGRFYEGAGDGTVPWWSAGVDFAWVADADHQSLFAEEAAFPDYLTLLRGDGRPKILRRKRLRGAGSRSSGSVGYERRLAEAIPEFDRVPSRSELTARLLGAAPRVRDEDKALVQRTFLAYVTHGDVSSARWPVAVGHYLGEDIQSVERVLDKASGDRLSALLSTSSYPGQLGQHLLVPGEDGRLILVVGLGSPGDLTPYHLGETLRDAFIQYTLNREGQSRVGLSCLLIGAQSLRIEDSVSEIVRGVLEANHALSQLGGPYLNELEFIERYQDRALEALEVLRDLSRSGRKTERVTCRLEAAPTLRVSEGGLTHRSRRRFTAAWPHRARVAVNKIRTSDGGEVRRIQFELITQRARAEVNAFEPDWETVKVLINGIRDDITTDTLAGRPAGRVLFSLVVPQSLRSSMKVRLPLQLILDREAASVPWEIMRDSDTEPPPATRFALTRQLGTAIYRTRPRDTHARRVVIMADIESAAPLDGAHAEGLALERLFQDRGWEVESVIGHDATIPTIRAHLTPPMPAVLHIAAHGVLVKNIHGVEVSALGLPGGRDGDVPRYLLRAEELAQLDPLPQLVFLNTCHSGRIADGDAALRSHGTVFAPDIATGLISAGVRAVVVTGWEVDDDAALLFARTFWSQMLDGAVLGEALLEARYQTWKAFPDLDTFGAYQAYGDPGFQLRRPPVGRPHFGSRRAVLDELERVTHGADLRTDQFKALRAVEAAISKRWYNDAEINLRLGEGWMEAASAEGYDDSGKESIRALYRALQWFQRASTREGSNLRGIERALETWNLILESWKHADKQHSTQRRDLFRVLFDYTPSKKTAPQQSLPQFLHGAALSEALCDCYIELFQVPEDSEWGFPHRLERMWSPHRVRELIESLNESLEKTVGRLQLLGDAHMAQAERLDSWSAALKHLEEAQRSYRVIVKMTQHLALETFSASNHQQLIQTPHWEIALYFLLKYDGTEGVLSSFSDDRKDNTSLSDASVEATLKALITLYEHMPEEPRDGEAPPETHEVVADLVAEQSEVDDDLQPVWLTRDVVSFVYRMLLIKLTGNYKRDISPTPDIFTYTSDSDPSITQTAPGSFSKSSAYIKKR